MAITKLEIIFSHNEHGAEFCAYTIQGPLSTDIAHNNCIPYPEAFKLALQTAQYLAKVDCDFLGVPSATKEMALQADPTHAPVDGPAREDH